MGYAATIAGVPRAGVSKADHAYAALRRVVLLCEVAPGQSLSEADLIRLSGEPRTPTREAAMRLINEGLLDVMPRQGYRVTSISVESASQLLDLYAVLTREILRPPPTPRDAVIVDGLEGLMADPPEQGDPLTVERLLAFSEALSALVVERTDNPWLADILRGLSSHILRLWVFAWDHPIRETIDRGYGQVLAALQADGDAFDPIFEGVQDWVKARTLAGLRARLGGI